MKSKKYLNEVLPIFGVNEATLKEKIKKIKPSHGYSNSFESIPSFEDFISLEDIGSLP